jgi:hypothetical protein
VVHVSHHFQPCLKHFQSSHAPANWEHILPIEKSRVCVLISVNENLDFTELILHRLKHCAPHQGYIVEEESHTSIKSIQFPTFVVRVISLPWCV